MPYHLCAVMMILHSGCWPNTEMPVQKVLLIYNLLYRGSYISAYVLLNLLKLIAGKR